MLSPPFFRPFISPPLSLAGYPNILADVNVTELDDTTSLFKPEHIAASQSHSHEPCSFSHQL